MGSDYYFARFIGLYLLSLVQVALEGMRLTTPPGVSHHIARLISICMNENPGKRPSFEMILPIVEKMQR